MQLWTAQVKTLRMLCYFLMNFWSLSGMPASSKT